jgi:putative protease
MLPVGSYESLRAAIVAGADSVYFGVEKLNMRARSSANFTIDDMRKIADICRSHNICSYLTLNVVVFDNELVDIQRIVDAAKAAGVSAIIASDQAVINYAHKVDVEVHISTQLNISNVEAVKFYSRYADVMVLARELNLEQVKYIHQQIVEQNICGKNGNLVALEMFCHGALCVAVSGKCYMSLHESGNSANRGACLQTCRKGYMLTNSETGYAMTVDNEYIMSPKDLCTIEFLDKMLDAGVRLFKVEGRARPPEYVKRVCENYNAAFDAIFSNNYTDELKQTLKNNLVQVFNRGFWDGYYLGQKMGEWSSRYGSNAAQHKEYLAKVTNFYDKLNVAELLMEAGTLSVGDRVLVIGPTTGVVETTVADIRIDDGTKALRVDKENVFSIKMPQKVRRGDKLYKWVSNDV